MELFNLLFMCYTSPYGCHSYLWKEDRSAYLKICENQWKERKDLDAVFSLLDIWKAEHNSSVLRKPFHTAAEILESVRQERFTFYPLHVMTPGMNSIETTQEIHRFNDTSCPLFVTNPYPYPA